MWSLSACFSKPRRDATSAGAYTQCQFISSFRPIHGNLLSNPLSSLKCPSVSSTRHYRSLFLFNSEGLSLTHALASLAWNQALTPSFLLQLGWVDSLALCIMAKPLCCREGELRTTAHPHHASGG